MSKLFFAIGIVLSFFTSIQAHATPLEVDETIQSLTIEQQYLLKKAFEVGKLLDLPETLQAVLLQETFAGKHGRVNWGNQKVAFGVTQIKPSTAKDVIEKRYKDLAHIIRQDESFIDKLSLGVETISDHRQALLTNDLHALVLSAIILHDNLRQTGNWRRSVVAYYEGVTGSRRLNNKEIENHFYFKGIAQNLKIARSFNTLKGLQ